MNRLKIKHFGPIKEGVPNEGWIELRKVSVLIGNDGSGKSTVAKLTSTFLGWKKPL